MLNCPTMYGILLGIFKVLSAALAAGFGILALLTEFKDKHNRITRNGKIALSGIIASFTVSIAVAALEMKKEQDDAKAHQQELVDQFLAIGSEIRATIRISTKYTTYDFKDPTEYWNVPNVMDIFFYREKAPCALRVKAPPTADLQFTSNEPDVPGEDAAKHIFPEEGYTNPRAKTGDTVYLKRWGSATLTDRNGHIRSVNDLPGATVLIMTDEATESGARVVAFSFLMSPGVVVRGGGEWSSNKRPLEESVRPNPPLPLVARGYCYTITKDDIHY
jgi:hypothetical protein